MIRVAINGFGRIGRNFFKQAFERRDELEIVAINDLGDPENLAYLLRYDSVYGRYGKEVAVQEDEGDDGGGVVHLVVDGVAIRILNEKDPAALPWGTLGIDVVVESTGVFTDPAKAAAHLEAGAKRVVISAPAKGEGAQHRLVGANDDQLADKTLGKITSDASCTTNAVVPVLAVLGGNPGIEKALMTTVHGYTASQNLVDGPSRKWRRGRAAAHNIVPSTTGAAIAASKSLPGFDGIFDAMAMRVPVIAGSIVDLTFVAKRDVTAEEINDILRAASQQDRWKGILTVTDEPLVSSDVIGDPHASIVDAEFTRVVGGNLVKVLAWYDNEWGYTNTLVEHVARVGTLETE